jgi:hypothetical protein
VDVFLFVFDVEQYGVALVESAPSPTGPICQHPLAKIDPSQGASTVIGNTRDCFARLAFHSNGTLYGVTNSEGAVPPSLFTLDTTSATPTFLISFDTVGVSSGAGFGGSGFAFDTSNGLIDRSGQGAVGVSHQVFQAINPNTLAVTDIPLSGSPTDEIIALTHAFGNTLLGADVGNRLFSITTQGVRTLIGPMDHLARGLVAQGLVFATTHAPFDFDGDGKSDIAVYRNGVWYIRRSSDGGTTTAEWGGLPQDRPVPGDYDGDGKVDIAVYRDGTWFILRSSDGEVRATGWGGVLADVPVPADYDGDGKADIAVYRGGTWLILRSSDGGQTTVDWGGLPQDVPVPADFDGDGKADVAVYRDGTWLILRSSDGAMTSTGWGGAPEDIPLNRPRKG